MAVHPGEKFNTKKTQTQNSYTFWAPILISVFVVIRAAYLGWSASPVFKQRFWELKCSPLLPVSILNLHDWYTGALSHLASRRGLLLFPFLPSEKKESFLLWNLHNSQDFQGSSGEQLVNWCLVVMGPTVPCSVNSMWPSVLTLGVIAHLFRMQASEWILSSAVDLSHNSQMTKRISLNTLL